MPRETFTNINISNTQRVSNLDLGSKKKFLINDAFIGRHHSPQRSFYDFDDLRCVQSLRLDFQNDNSSSKPVELSESILNRLTSYFQERPDKNEYFDCLSFVLYLHGKPYCKEEINRSNWNISKFDDVSELYAGNTFIIGNLNANPIWPSLHFGLYLAEGITLSKIGNGPLVFAPFKELQKYYHTNAQWIIEPKVDI